MIKLTNIYKNNIPLGYFKRIVRQYPVFNPELGVRNKDTGSMNRFIGRKLGKGDDKKGIMGRRKSSLGISNTNAEKFTIFRVNSKLVDSKNLNKYLKKVVKRDFKKDEIEYLLKYIVTNMPQTLDDLNVVTIMIMMNKLDIRDNMLINSIIPYMYKMKDFDKITECILYGSMLFGENDSLKVFATKLVCEIPEHINSINYDNVSKLCESLCNLNMYSEEFGKVISSLVDRDTLIGNEIPILNFSSILNYLSRVGVGDESVWKMYTKYSLDNLSISNYKIIMRILQSYSNRNIFNKEILKNAGDRMIRYIEIMHPNDVANLSYIYFKMNYKHDLLFEEIFKVGERIATNLDGCGSLRLLAGYYLYFSQVFKLGEPVSNVSDKKSTTSESYLSFNSSVNKSNTRTNTSEITANKSTTRTNITANRSDKSDIAIIPTISTPMFINNVEWDRYLHCFRSVYLIYNNISNNLNSLNFDDFLLLFKTIELFSFINTNNLQTNLKVFLRDYDKSRVICPKNIDIIKMRFSEKKLINPGEQRFIRLLMS